MNLRRMWKGSWSASTSNALGKLAAGLSLAALVGSGTGCSRNNIEAIDMANLGDQAVKVNVSAAIQKYEEAIRLDPSNHRILWKLAMAYEKQEEWSKMESTLSQAMSQAPSFAEYAYRRGYALVRIAEGGNREAYEDAKAPLKKCVETDVNFAECYHWLGQAYYWTDDEQAALENYTKAIEHDPKTGYFYPPLAELYVSLRMYDSAEKVLKAGDQLLEKVEKNKNALYAIYTLQSNVYQAKKADTERLAALERANEIAGESHPEIAFNLGSTYATMKPPQKDKAVRLLKSFNKRACKSASAQTKFKDQCEISNALVSKLGGE